MNKTGHLDLLATGAGEVSAEANRIGASTPYDFEGKNLTAYGGLLPVATMLEKLGFQQIVEETLTVKRATHAMSMYQFVLAMMLAVYVGFSRLNHLRFLEREPMLTGILKVLRLPPQCTFWRFLASLHSSVARQLLEVQRRMRERVWEAAHVQIRVITLDTDTTVHRLFGKQMGGRKSYNPKNKGKKSYQRMSSEGWCIQWESTPPEQESEFCSLDSREERKLNPGSLSTKPSLGMVSESLGRNENERTGDPETLYPRGRAPVDRAKAAWNVTTD